MKPGFQLVQTRWNPGFTHVFPFGTRSYTGVKVRNKLIMEEKRTKRATSKPCGIMICLSWPSRVATAGPQGPETHQAQHEHRGHRTSRAPARPLPKSHIHAVTRGQDE